MKNDLCEKFAYRHYDSLYDHLLELQKIPDAYSQWESYRTELTNFILSHSEKGSSILIIGAGECNDLNLRKISSYFSKIILLDRDLTAVKNGIVHQKADMERIILLQHDLIGISSDSYRSLCSDMKQECKKLNSDFESDSYQKITDWYLERIQVLFKNRIYIPVQSRLESIDNVICCGIHSQLLAVLAQIACVFGRVINMNIQAVFQRISMLNDVVCSQLTDDLFAVSKHSVILGLERIHVGMEGEIEGASQAFHSLSPYWIYLKDRSSLIWPFDKAQGKVYSMEILDFGCKENLFK